VIDKLARDGFDPVYGARPLRREVERQIENPLAMKIVKGECKPGCQVDISAESNEIIFVIS
jgi:ATP-dependent Clp protease ATP-binding subunit ClpC